MSGRVGEAWIVFVIIAGLCSLVDLQLSELPPYIKQCKSNDDNLIDCFTQAIHHIKPYLAQGIPGIMLPSTEPFRIPELSLSLTTGPNGYKITLRDIDVYGASNFSASKLKLSDGVNPFEVGIFIPQLKINAKYTSSGVLIIIPASGNGSFHSVLGDVSTVCRGMVSTVRRDGLDYLHIDQMSLELNVKTVKMVVKKIFNNNRILTEATNLFLRENGHEVLKAMIPQLKKKLANVFMQIGNQVFDRVPLQQLYMKV